jgi:hypothetical protein
MLNETLLGLTTAHAIFNCGNYDTLQSGLEHDAENTNRSNTNADERATRENDSRLSVPATLWAASFGSLNYTGESTSVGTSPSVDRTCRDFALLELQPEQNESTRNTYRSSGNHVSIDTTSQDMSARTVQVVCSATDVRSGHLLEGECVILDKAGYWETRKIQLDAPLGRILPRMLYGVQYFGASSG